MMAKTKNKLDQDIRPSDTNFDRLCLYLNRLPTEFRVLGVRDGSLWAPAIRCSTSSPDLVARGRFCAFRGGKRPFDKLRAVPSTLLRDGERSRTVSEVEPRSPEGRIRQLTHSALRAWLRLRRVVPLATRSGPWRTTTLPPSDGLHDAVGQGRPSWARRRVVATTQLRGRLPSRPSSGYDAWRSLTSATKPEEPQTRH
jgi:hypothetical protein